MPPPVRLFVNQLPLRFVLPHQDVPVVIFRRRDKIMINAQKIKNARDFQDNDRHQPEFYRRSFHILIIRYLAPINKR